MQSDDGVPWNDLAVASVATIDGRELLSEAPLRRLIAEIGDLQRYADRDFMISFPDRRRRPFQYSFEESLALFPTPARDISGVRRADKSVHSRQGSSA
jgi:hypothetical protein